MRKNWTGRWAATTIRLKNRKTGQDGLQEAPDKEKNAGANALTDKAVGPGMFIPQTALALGVLSCVDIS